MSVLELALCAKSAAPILAQADSNLKNKALFAIADAIERNVDNILRENAKDIQNAKASGISASLIDRLSLSEKRLRSIADSVREVAGLNDPIGEVLGGCVRPNGLAIRKIRVPIGVCGIIYEARPNVTVDAAVLCLKSGNVCLLRGGKEAICSNSILVSVMQEALRSVGLPAAAVSFINDVSRESSNEMMKLNGILDVLIPRGGAGLINAVVNNSTVPVIQTGVGNCHIYVDSSADIGMAVDIAVNAKCSRPSVCNAAETFLVHSSIASAFLFALKPRLDEYSVETHGCDITKKILGDCVIPATEEDYEKEYLDYKVAIKVVDSLDEAIDHINKFGTRHSECIVTSDVFSAETFTKKIDAAAVYVNASTRFTDGGEFGLGAEIGISTQKLHARGPMGLSELTTYKYIVSGNGQIR
ncbi:MAG: glutamate-5-semialdehyde dehydrogenase [Oscillospiraceae bacterium]|nr:glutamate-5-semialdehyde dehydrogenase [Oscillospiraceae bacterium]